MMLSNVSPGPPQPPIVEAIREALRRAYEGWDVPVPAGVRAKVGQALGLAVEALELRAGLGPEVERGPEAAALARTLLGDLRPVARGYDPDAGFLRCPPWLQPYVAGHVRTLARLGVQEDMVRFLLDGRDADDREGARFPSRRQAGDLYAFAAILSKRRVPSP